MALIQFIKNHWEGDFFFKWKQQHQHTERDFPILLVFVFCVHFIFIDGPESIHLKQNA